MEPTNENADGLGDVTDEKIEDTELGDQRNDSSSRSRVNATSSQAKNLSEEDVEVLVRRVLRKRRLWFVGSFLSSMLICGIFGFQFIFSSLKESSENVSRIASEEIRQELKGDIPAQVSHAVVQNPELVANIMEQVELGIATGSTGERIRKQTDDIVDRQIAARLGGSWLDSRMEFFVTSDVFVRRLAEVVRKQNLLPAIMDEEYWRIAEQRAKGGRIAYSTVELMFSVGCVDTSAKLNRLQDLVAKKGQAEARRAFLDQLAESHFREAYPPVLRMLLSDQALWSDPFLFRSYFRFFLLADAESATKLLELYVNGSADSAWLPVLESLTQVAPDRVLKVLLDDIDVGGGTRENLAWNVLSRFRGISEFSNAGIFERLFAVACEHSASQEVAFIGWGRNAGRLSTDAQDESRFLDSVGSFHLLRSNSIPVLYNSEQFVIAPTDKIPRHIGGLHVVVISNLLVQALQRFAPRSPLAVVLSSRHWREIVDSRDVDKLRLAVSWISTVTNGIASGSSESDRIVADLLAVLPKDSLPPRELEEALIVSSINCSVEFVVTLFDYVLRRNQGSKSGFENYSALETQPLFSAVCNRGLTAASPKIRKIVGKLLADASNGYPLAQSISAVIGSSLNSSAASFLCGDENFGTALCRALASELIQGVNAGFGSFANIALHATPGDAGRICEKILASSQDWPDYAAVRNQQSQQAFNNLIALLTIFAQQHDDCASLIYSHTNALQLKKPEDSTHEGRRRLPLSAGLHVASRARTPEAMLCMALNLGWSRFYSDCLESERILLLYFLEHGSGDSQLPHSLNRSKETSREARIQLSEQWQALLKKVDKSKTAE